MAGAHATFTRVRRESGLLWASTLALDRVIPFGALRLWPPRVVPAALLAEQVETILRAWGLSEEHAAITVEKMLYADLHGIDSHGCSKLHFYDELRAEGRLNPKPAIEIVREGEGTVLIDGGGGLGHVPASLAMERAIDRSLATGVGVAAVRNSGHYGAAGAYAAMPAERGLIGIATTSTPTRTVVPTFGREAMLGSNAIAVAAPAARNRPFLLDMATSTVSLGKLVERWRSGRRIPRGWALDDRGRAVRGGRAALRHRRLAPLGGDAETSGYKGYGLSLAVEILSTLLPGVDLAGSGDERRPVGHFFLALDPAAFRERGALAGELDELIDSLHEAPPASPGRPVLVPGDPEERVLAERSVRGIPLSKGVFEDIRAVAIASGAPFVLDQRRS
jgi:LDH2 family malate/lactate/ureidoglycolate dehydrogenase